MRWYLNQQYSTAYDIPVGIFDQDRSPAFAGFFENWFVNTWAVSRRELDLGFLKDMSPEETELAKDLLRRNLGLKYVHIIEGVTALHDLEAVPILREMASNEASPSRQLTMAGALWRLVRDPIFIDCLNRMKASGNAGLKRAHLHQVVWLRDERAIDFLIYFLDDPDRAVRFQALQMLNEVEFDRRIPADQLPKQPTDYKDRRNDVEFRRLMIAHLQHVRS